jgi:single-strand DNA-binding protein
MLVGNLGADPEVRTIPGGHTVAKFSVATKDSWTDKSGERQERTEWHRISVWGKTAQICGDYLGKGKKVHIEGRLRTNEWQDKETAQKRYSTEIVADRVLFLDRRPGSSEQTELPEPPSSGGYDEVAE